MSSKIDNNIIRSYNKNGYIILNIFNKSEIEGFKKKIKKKSEIILKKKKWNLSMYHNFVDDGQNQKITDQKNRFINVNSKIINKINENRNIKNILQNKWNHSKFLIPDQKYLIGKIKKTSLKNIKRNEIPFRIVRPHKKNILVQHHHLM